MSMPSMALSPSRVEKELRRCLKAKLVPIITSSPGMGKSEIVQKIADQAGLKLLDWRVAQADITDFNGLPRFTEDGRAEYAPFRDFPLAGDPLPLRPDGTRYNGWLLFFDELTSAQKQLQAAAYKVLLERKIGQHPLHQDVWMIGAGNLATDNAVVHDMSTALQSRLIHLEMQVNKEDWIRWAIENGIDSRIIAFIEFKPANLHRFDPDHNDKTFACPRTWVFAHKLISGQETLSATDDLPLLAGTISAGVASEFITFTQIFDSLPKISEIEKNPKTVHIPSEPSTRYALAVMLSEYFTDTNASALVDFLQRLPVEARVLCLRIVAQRKPSLIRHPALGEAMQTLVRM